MPEPTRDLSPLSLADIERLATERRGPPIAQWNPPLSGHSRIRIARDGRWYHDGGLIERENLVRTFSTILRREPDQSYVLVTPVEKQTVDVEDAPFLAVEMKGEGAGRAARLAFRTNVGDLIVAGADHPIRFARNEQEPAPYLLVRPGIEARLSRPVFYELANRALDEASDPLGVWSGGVFFSMAALI